MASFFEIEDKQEVCVLVSVDTGEFDAEASIDELEELAHTAGAVVFAKLIQKRERPDNATYLGEGKLFELKTICINNDIDLLIFDGELTPSQQRNIENYTDIRVIDRTMLILDVNYFDTAFIYPGSEYAIGEVFQKNNIRDKVFIATKLPPQLMRSIDILDKLLNEQLKRLRTDHIDFFLFHMMSDIKVWERLQSMGIEK